MGEEWVVQKDTNGPFAETSRVPDDLYRVIRAVPGVREASPVAFQSLQFDLAAIIGVAAILSVLMF